MGSGEETRARWGAGDRGGEGAGGCGHALAAFKYSLHTQKMQPGVGGRGGVVWAVGVVWQPLNTLSGVSSGEAGVGWGVGRWGWGVGTHWQPLSAL